MSDATAASTSTPLREYWPRRFTLVGFCFLSSYICYIDRVNISVAIIPMATEFGWDKTTQGLVLSSFFFGYMATQILGGWLADRFGGKAVLGFGVVWWSIFTMLTPPAAAVSLTLLLVTRALMGMGEGVNFPAVLSMFGRWIPIAEKARSTALVYSGISLGTVTALLLTPWIVAEWGWRVVFYAYGAAGVVWWFFWWWKTTDLPSEHPTIRETEVAHIRSGLPEVAKAAAVPWRLLFSKVPVWALIINHFCANWGFYVMLAWLPTYFNEGLGVNIREVGVYSFLPYVAMFVMANIAAQIADRMIARGVSVTATRNIMQTIGMVGPAAAFTLVGMVNTPMQGVAVMTAALFFGAFALVGFAVNHLDIAPKYAGSLLGVTNTAGTIPGIIGVVVSGALVDSTGSWASAFLLAAGIYLFGIVVWLLFSTGERIVD